VSTTSYLIDHLFGSILGVPLATFSDVALGASPAVEPAFGAHSDGSGVAGNALILTVFGMSTFATPAVGGAYLEGMRTIVEVNQDILGPPLVVTALAGGALGSPLYELRQIAEKWTRARDGVWC
jgi:hypothetical protein